MPAVKKSISLTEAENRKANARMAAGRHRSFSAYIGHLINEDYSRHIAPAPTLVDERTPYEVDDAS